LKIESYDELLNETKMLLKTGIIYENNPKTTQKQAKNNPKTTLMLM
jgi:hypothetical protein